jgi:hypothetical protein
MAPLKPTIVRLLTSLSAACLGLTLYSLGSVLSDVGSGAAHGRGRAALIGALVFLVPFALGAALAAILAFRQADELRRRQLVLLMAVIATPVGAALLVNGARPAPENGVRSAGLDPSPIPRSGRLRRYRRRPGRGPLSVAVAAAPPRVGGRGGSPGRIAV